MICQTINILFINLIKWVRARLKRNSVAPAAYASKATRLQWKSKEPF